MTMHDPRIDAYIAEAPAFARPILAHIRVVVHDSGIEIGETIKWGMPYFEHEGLVCGMATFMAHCAPTFRRGEAVTAKGSGTTGAMGQFGRLAGLDDLPDDEAVRALVKRAVALNEADAARKG
jgi:hypothetical protein